MVSSSHDQALAGQVFENELLLTLVKRFAMEKNIDLLADPLSEQRLREAVEKAKTELSTIVRTNINLPYITADAKGPKVSFLRFSGRFILQIISYHPSCLAWFCLVLPCFALFCLVLLFYAAPERRRDEGHV